MFDKICFKCYHRFSMRLLKNLIGGMVDIVYPKICHVCKQKMTAASINEIVCVECWAKIKKNSPPFCYKCGRKLTEKSAKNTCLDCIKKPLHFDRAFSPCVYEGVIKELIHGFKYKKHDYLGFLLAKLMIEFIKDYNLPPMQLTDLIIPVPLHKAKLREREFNHAFVLSKYLGLEFNKEVLNGKLLRRANTRTQTELSDNERFLNVKGCFKTMQGNQLLGRNVLLIDDVLTTGATASEAACELKNAGAEKVYVFTLAN